MAKDLLGLIKAVGSFGEIYGKYCNTKLELEKIKTETKFLLAQQDAQTKSENLKVNAMLKYELAKIEERKVALAVALNASIEEMRLIHTERMEYIKILKIFSEAMIDPARGADERAMAREGMKDFQSLIIAAGEKGKMQLTVLHESARKVLESIPSAHYLLEGN